MGVMLLNGMFGILASLGSKKGGRNATAFLMAIGDYLLKSFYHVHFPDTVFLDERHDRCLTLS